jgi:4a-hydroxytetrahydrobiopterin dehydratase
MASLTLTAEDKAQTRCPACGCVGAKLEAKDLLSPQDIAREMTTLKWDWLLSEDGKRITRTFKTRNFKGAIDFINKAAVIAEDDSVSHHPDIHLTHYRQLEICCWTHATNGLTVADFILARALEDIEIDYSPSWLKKKEAEAGIVATATEVVDPKI